MYLITSHSPHVENLVPLANDWLKNKQTDFQVFNNGVMAWQSNPWGNLKATHTTDQVVASDELHRGVLQGKS